MRICLGFYTSIQLEIYWQFYFRNTLFWSTKRAASYMFWPFFMEQVQRDSVQISASNIKTIWGLIFSPCRSKKTYLLGETHLIIVSSAVCYSRCRTKRARMKMFSSCKNTKYKRSCERGVTSPLLQKPTFCPNQRLFFRWLVSNILKLSKIPNWLIKKQQSYAPSQGSCHFSFGVLSHNVIRVRLCKKIRQDYIYLTQFTVYFLCSWKQPPVWFTTDL